jgi:hypothetical protein
MQGLVVACGIRKMWAKEFKDIDTPSQQIKRLKEILAELGMTGRLSLEQAKAIKEKRELAQELGTLFCSIALVDNLISEQRMSDHSRNLSSAVVRLGNAQRQRLRPPTIRTVNLIQEKAMWKYQQSEWSVLLLTHSPGYLFADTPYSRMHGRVLWRSWAIRAMRSDDHSL